MKEFGTRLTHLGMSKQGIRAAVKPREGSNAKLLRSGVKNKLVKINGKERK
jgi:hypothetical protein